MSPTSTQGFKTVVKLSNKQKDPVLVLIGLTGAGKSTFIKVATGDKGNIGHGQQPCTLSIEPYTCEDHAHNETTRVCLVDTPGFDRGDAEDAQNYSEIAEYLCNQLKGNPGPVGIILFHRISDNRMSGSQLNHLENFNKLCGHDFFRNVAIVTTMWTASSDPSLFAVYQDRETQLKSEHWKPFIEHGASAESLKPLDYDRAWSIIRHLVARLQESTKVSAAPFEKASQKENGHFKKLRNPGGEEVQRQVIKQLKSLFDQVNFWGRRDSRKEILRA